MPFFESGTLKERRSTHRCGAAELLWPGYLRCAARMAIIQAPNGMAAPTPASRHVRTTLGIASSSPAADARSRTRVHPDHGPVSAIRADYPCSCARDRHVLRHSQWTVSTIKAPTRDPAARSLILPDPHLLKTKRLGSGGNSVRIDNQLLATGGQGECRRSRIRIDGLRGDGTRYDQCLSIPTRG